MRVCIIIPAYNASATLRSLLESLLPFAESILVVDDGSEDETSSIAEGFAAQGVTLLRHGRNRGKGAALRTGFSWALQEKCDVAVTMDSDLQHDPADLPGLLSVFAREHLDVLIGSRLHDQKDMPPLRRLGNWFSSWGTGRFCHQQVFDAQCGLRLYRLAACRKMLSELKLDRFVSESEALVRASMNLLRIGFAPIKVIYPQSSQHQSFYRPWSDTARIVVMFTWELLRRTFTRRGRRELRELKQYVKSCSDWPRYYMLPGPGDTQGLA